MKKAFWWIAVLVMIFAVEPVLAVQFGITGPCIDPMGGKCSDTQSEGENGPQLDPNGTTIMLAQLSCSEQPCAARCDCQFSSCQNWCDDIPWWNIEFWECRRGCQEDYRYCQDECAGEYGPPPAGPQSDFVLISSIS